MIWCLSKSTRAGCPVRRSGLCAFVVALSVNTARAQDAQYRCVAGRSILATLEAFQKSAPDLNKSIQESAGAIDGITDSKRARRIDKLRETVSTLLGAVSDNGPYRNLASRRRPHP